MKVIVFGEFLKVPLNFILCIDAVVFSASTDANVGEYQRRAAVSPRKPPREQLIGSAPAHGRRSGGRGRCRSFDVVDS
ncbi:hypothetical protein ACS0TY_025513 [Phlomoides rotata]